jgi:uncharacterized Tic20 family protein
MNDRIPLKFRLIAAGMYMTPIVLTALIHIYNNANPQMHQYSFLMALEATFVIWLPKMNGNPFLDRHGIEMAYLGLNCVVAILLDMVLSGITEETYLSGIEAFISFSAYDVALFFCFVSLTISTIFALRGQCFKNPLIYRLF